MKCTHSLPQEALLRTSQRAWRHSDISVPLMGVNSLLSLDDTSLEPDFRISHIFSRASQIHTLVSDDNLCFFAIEFILIWLHSSHDLASATFLVHTFMRLLPIIEQEKKKMVKEVE